MSIINEIGNKYSRLLVIARSENSKEGRAKWLCKCDCGKETIVLGKHLRSGNTKSCGCLQKEKVTERNLENGGNLINKKFGKLTVIKEDGFFIHKNGKRSRLWLCQCDCGNIVSVQHQYLQFGDTTSCGCIHSKGEFQIEQILKENNIQFEREYSFKDLKDKIVLRFDFAIFKDNEILCLIEFQGEQHYYSSNGFYTEDLIKHDEMKIEYCKEKNIPLKIIRYKRNHNMKIEELELEDIDGLWNK